MDYKKSSQQQQQPTRKTGVADYFAILGVGDQLIWKHDQKQSMYAAAGSEEPLSAEEADGNNEQAQERFMREIVDLAILTLPDSDESPPSNGVADQVSETASLQQVLSNVSDSLPHLSAVSVNTSFYSDTTSVNNHKPTPNSDSLRNEVGVAAGNVQEQLEQWTAIQKTLPTATAGFVPIQDEKELDEEHEGDGDSFDAMNGVNLDPSRPSVKPRGPLLWPKHQTWSANLSWNFGLRAQVCHHRSKVVKAVTVNHTPLKGIHSKLQSKLKQVMWAKSHEDDDDDSHGWHAGQQKFVLAYRRRRSQAEHPNDNLQQHMHEETNEHGNVIKDPLDILDTRPGIADLRLFYVRLHRNLLIPLHPPPLSDVDAQSAASEKTTKSSGVGTLSSLLEGAFASQAKAQFSFLTKATTQQHNKDNDDGDVDSRTLGSHKRHSEQDKVVSVENHLHLPDGFEEWSIPQEYRRIRDPSMADVAAHDDIMIASKSSQDPTGVNKQLFQAKEADDEPGSIEVAALSPSDARRIDGLAAATKLNDALLPCLVTQPPHDDFDDESLNNFCYIPVVAYRRQRIGDEERYHEDPAIIEMAVTFLDAQGKPVMPADEEEENGFGDDFDFEAANNKNDSDFCVLGKTPWIMAGKHPTHKKRPTARRLQRQFGSPAILVRKNVPFGFADAAFATKVLDRFPARNYKGLPLPQEELPMFCYPTGCRLFRARYSDAPLAQYYGFVVKNERGDSIYVSCVSFMEPLTSQKVEQLARMSEKRKRTSLPHLNFCERREKKRQRRLEAKDHHRDDVDLASDCSTEADTNFLLTGFDDMTTFENKTICLVSRYPFWTAFRKFLSHLHILSGSVSDIPLERCISHLLLSVPIPRAGGHNVIIPLTTLNEPMILTIPPEKDFPVLDLPYHRLVACLEINTIVMIVLGMLALEKKVIVMSKRPSLVLDVCELLRSLLFPFELCAPYVPRLTEPFKSSLDFPGAIFVGIHDDGSPHGLAATVRKELPEDSIVVDLETGEIESDMDRLDVLKNTWDILPQSQRSDLVKELQALCNDAGIDDGQEPLDSQYDSAFEVSLPDAVEDADVDILDDNDEKKEPLDDRAFRDAFLRFFCNVLGGYERFLVVPDADFLISGNDYFDSQGFLASVRSDRAPYLGALVSTQLFQSFIQRRTEASDVHCLLFDECMEEYHASPKPYGRLGEDMGHVQEEGDEKPRVVYSLLVDQSAAFPLGHEQLSFVSNKSFDASEADSGVVTSLKSSVSFAESYSKYAESAFNPMGDLVTAPSREGLPPGQRYIYCIDGNPCFPHKLNEKLFLPKEPESWLVEMSKSNNPLLARSERELEESDRRRRMATSYHGFQKQRRCLWQLPKLMGSHFLGAWLLCIPVQVSQPGLSHDQQSRYLMRALGALRILRGKQRIVPDEAAYRSLMVACARSRNDRRTELVKLFGLLRSDGIFPSALTLGSYTKALAEGYSKQLSGGNQDDDGVGGEFGEAASRVGRLSSAGSNQRTLQWETALASMDGHLGPLEEQGHRWRNKHGADRKDPEQEDGKDHDEKRKRTTRSWLPIVYSSSFVPINSDLKEVVCVPGVQLIAIWSKTRACRNCTYIPLEEEVQAGWDVVAGDEESAEAISCPRCGSLFVPMLGVREFTLEEARAGTMNTNDSEDPELLRTADFAILPPQICPRLSAMDAGRVASKLHFVAYKSPAAVRAGLEIFLEEYGEDILSRDKLKELDPELLYNFWWYCARFALPLPLSVAISSDAKPCHCVAFAGWDQAIAERACFSAAQVLSPIFAGPMDFVDHFGDQIDPFDDHPLLSRLNLQGYYASVWDHPELSKILVFLVEACDKRDFKPVIAEVLKKNKQRKELYGGSHDGVSVELDPYRTILYLAKYQCTTAFHAFFPATIKPCKGYHFWCAIGQPLPIFDRLLRDGVQRLDKDKNTMLSVHDVSDVALGFRCVFGHLI